VATLYEDYELLREKNHLSLVDEVRQKLAEGFIPLGGAFFDLGGYCQTLAKPRVGNTGAVKRPPPHR
jgi:hypothetical protein